MTNKDPRIEAALAAYRKAAGGGIHAKLEPMKAAIAAADAAAWRPIGEAPRDGKVIYATNSKEYQRGLVAFNEQGEWELVDHNLSPMGIGFYPTHFQPLPQPPEAWSES